MKKDVHTNQTWRRDMVRLLFSHGGGRSGHTLLGFLMPFLLSCLTGLVLFQEPSFGRVSSLPLSAGLDPARARFLASLLMTAGAALTGAMLGQRRLGALMDAGTVFAFGYLIGFFHDELQPYYGPGGSLEALNGVAPVHRGCVLLA